MGTEMRNIKQTFSLTESRVSSYWSEVVWKAVVNAAMSSKIISQVINLKKQKIVMKMKSNLCLIPQIQRNLSGEESQANDDGNNNG